MFQGDDIPEAIVRHMEASLSRMDQAVQELATNVSGTVSVYRDGVPERTIVARLNERLFAKLGISPVKRHAKEGWQEANYEFWLVAHVWADDDNTRRAWVQKISVIDNPSPDLAANRALLQSAWNAILQVEEKHLKPVANIQL